LAEQQLFFVGNQQPSISETITDELGFPVDLSGSSVSFKMRPVGSSTPKVDAPISSTPDASGVVRYDWGATDVDTPGQYLIWWEVTDTTGKSQDMGEALIEFRAHGPLSNGYIELEELKSSTELTSTSFADQDLQNAIVAASRSIDLATGRRFWPDTTDQTRYYTPDGQQTILIDDLITLTSLGTDTDDDGTAEYTWTLGTDFVLEPRNAPLDGFPYTSIRRLTYSNYLWPGSRVYQPNYHDSALYQLSYRDSVIVTGKFGWPAPPAAVKVATTMLAARFVKRMREAPFGIAGFDATGATVRISQTDPDVMNLIAPYVRRTLFV
jgi:hypothetical protein